MRKRITLTLVTETDNPVEALFVRHRMAIVSRHKRTKFDMACLLTGFAVAQGWQRYEDICEDMRSRIPPGAPARLRPASGDVMTLQFPLDQDIPTEQALITQYMEIKSGFKRPDFLLHNLLNGFVINYGWNYASR